MLITEKTEAALALARRAHAGQVDKAGKPYIEHPLAVAEAMKTEEETCAALLHDVLEDSNLTSADLRAAGMSENVVCAVELLTHDAAVDYFAYVRAVRENPLAAAVKRADLTHNSDLSRIPNPTPGDYARVEKYRKALQILEVEV